MLAGPSLTEAQSTLEPGADLPMKDRTMTSVSGDAVSIGSVKGEKGTVVTFWCNTCPWVKRWESRLVDLAKAYQSKGFGFIAVNSNDPVAYPGDNMTEMKAQASAKGYSFPYVADSGSELAVAFGAKRTPQVFVFDATDKLVYQGAIDDSPADEAKVTEAYLASALDAVLSGSPIATAETKAFGCTIKFQ
jgi:thiol-disulfide isomerase/thioredoxin